MDLYQKYEELREEVHILHLTLNKHWFDMIASGEKKQEYREIKPYWITRLHAREYDFIKFRNGYRKNSPTLLVECEGWSRGMGIPQWGAPLYTPVYILQLGKVLMMREGE